MNKKKTGILFVCLAGVLIVGSLLYAFVVDRNIRFPWQINGTMIGDRDQFNDPDLEYRPFKMLHNLGGAWDNNKIYSLSNKMDYLVQIGYGGIVTNVAWNSQYMQSDKDFDSMNRVLNAAEERGLGLWLYDEYWYPSGYANQMTLEGHPEYQAIGLSQLFRFGMGEEEIVFQLPDAYLEVIEVRLFSFVDGELQTDTSQKLENYQISQDHKLTVHGIGEDWKICVFFKAPVFTEKNTLEDVSGQKRIAPNLLNRDAVARFIELTYETYKEKIPGFSDRITAFFTDEPSIWTSRFMQEEKPADYPLVPWEDSIPVTFESKFGYSIYDYFGSLFAGDTDLDKRVRQNFYEIVGDLFSENYTGQIQAWCEANGVNLSGHYLFEETINYQIPLYGNLFQTMTRSGYPGIDDLNMDPETYMRSGLYISGKLASSAARYRDISTVMLELCPVHFTDDFYANHHENAMGDISLHYLAGINHVNLYYDPARDDNNEGIIFNNYAGRMGYMLSEAVMNSGIAVYYPTLSAQQYQIPSRTQNLMEANYELSAINSAVNSMARHLADANLDFDFFNEQIIEAATVERGYMLSGKAKYRVIILPSVEVIPLATMEKLHEFASKGGKLIFTGCLPDRSDHAAESESVKALANQYTNQLMDISPKGVAPNLALGASVVSTTLDSSSGIYRMEYITDGTADSNNFNGSWSGRTPSTITIDLGEAQDIDRAVVYTQTGYEMKAYELWYQANDEWIKLVSVEDNNNDIINHSFDKIHTQYFRIQALEGSAIQPETARVNELELFYTGEEKNQSNLFDRIRDWSSFELNIQAIDPDKNTLILASSFEKNGQTFAMIVNSSVDPIELSLEQKNVKIYRIYDPYDGSIRDIESDTLMINGNRALFVQPYR